MTQKLCMSWLESHNSFLQNGQAYVRLHGASNTKVHLQQGVPQGCVLSPLLFVFFIINVVDSLMEADPVRAKQLAISLFADDVTVLSRNKSRVQATADTQWAVDIIAEWSIDARTQCHQK